MTATDEKPRYLITSNAGRAANNGPLLPLMRNLLKTDAQRAAYDRLVAAGATPAAAYRVAIWL